MGRRASLGENETRAGTGDEVIPIFLLTKQPGIEGADSSRRIWRAFEPSWPGDGELRYSEPQP